MIRALVQIALNGVAVLIAAYLVPGIVYSGGLPQLLLVGLVLGVVNLIVKPVVSLLSLPLIMLTLGLFYLVINGLMLYLVAWLIPELQVQGCGAAILGGLVIALFNWVTRAFTSEN
ncbi:MAG TPA: phage holin family protein [Thermoanaerobaculia bacterium]|nr:phage holin family protein [Thermoanaerobaculia bacterium]